MPTLLSASGGKEVVVLPTAAAYQHPERVALHAAEWFATLGAQVEGLMVVDRASANDPGMAAVVRAARFVYLAGGSPLHLKSVLKDSATLDALREAWTKGAVVAGSAAGAMVLTDPMVDPRGGALTVGLGLVDQLAVVPQFGDGLEDAHGQKLQRTVALAPDRAAGGRDPGPHRPPPCRRRQLELRGRCARRWCSSTAPAPRGSAPSSANPPNVSQLSPPRRSSPTRS